MDGCMAKKNICKKWLVGRIKKMKKQMDGWMAKKIYEKNTDGWMDKKMKKQMDGWMVGWIKKIEKIDGWLEKI